MRCSLPFAQATVPVLAPLPSRQVTSRGALSFGWLSQVKLLGGLERYGLI